MSITRLTNTLVVGATLLSASLCSTAIAAPALQAHSLANTFVDEMQQSVRVAKDGNGNFVVVWQSLLQDGSSWGIFAQRFTRLGVPMGSEISVNTTTAGEQSLPDVAMDAQGNFIVVWQSAPAGTQNYGIFARRFDLTGSPTGGEFQVNTCRTGGQQFPAVAMDADGDAVVVWDSSDSNRTCAQERFTIRGQRYNAAGAATGTEFRVNTVEKTQSSQDVALPDVAMSATGAYVVTWQYRQSTTWDIFAKRYTNAGVVSGAQFRANTFTSNQQLEPKIAMDAAGNFMIAWRSEKQNGATGWNLYTQRYYANGSKRGSEARANTYPFVGISGTYTIPYHDFSVALSASGKSAIAWECQSVPTNSCIQQFNANGSQLDTWFYASQENFPRNPAIALDDEGYITVASDGVDSSSMNKNVYQDTFK